MDALWHSMEAIPFAQIFDEAIFGLLLLRIRDSYLR